MLSDPVVGSGDGRRLSVAGRSMAFSVAGGGDHLSFVEVGDEAVDHSNNENSTPKTIDSPSEDES